MLSTISYSNKGGLKLKVVVRFCSVCSAFHSRDHPYGIEMTP